MVYITNYIFSLIKYFLYGNSDFERPLALLVVISTLQKAFIRLPEKWKQYLDQGFVLGVFY